MVEKGCLLGWHFLYLPLGHKPDVTLMPTAEQRELLRQKGGQYIRQHKPIMVIDFWNDAPIVGGCIAGGQYYFHINAKGDVEPCVFVHLATENIKHQSLKKAINSPFFRGIRAHQPYSHNLLRPCLILDHPQLLRQLYNEFKTYPTDGVECDLVSNLASDMDKYSEEVAKVLDPIWEREFSPKPDKEPVKEGCLSVP